MISLFVVIIIAGVLCFLAIRNKEKVKEEIARFVVACLGVLMLCALVDFGIGEIVEKSCVSCEESVVSEHLLALQDSKPTGGRFLLGSGSTDSGEHYVYYVKGEHGYVRQVLDADSDESPVYINFVSLEERPRVDTYSMIKTLNAKPSPWLSFSASLKYRGVSVGETVNETPSIVRTEFYIPEGSIREGYQVDMEQ